MVCSNGYRKRHGAPDFAWNNWRNIWGCETYKDDPICRYVYAMVVPFLLVDVNELCSGPPPFVTDISIYDILTISRAAQKLSDTGLVNMHHQYCECKPAEDAPPGFVGGQCPTLYEVWAQGYKRGGEIPGQFAVPPLNQFPDCVVWGPVLGTSTDYGWEPGTGYFYRHKILCYGMREPYVRPGQIPEPQWFVFSAGSGGDPAIVDNRWTIYCIRRQDLKEDVCGNAPPKAPDREPYPPFPTFPRDIPAPPIPGVRGPVGPTGPSGPVGPVGPTGPKGDSITGPKGDRGEPGAKGDKGDQGQPGIKGDKGDKGDAGPKGDQGERGLVGEPGIQGPRGLPGSPGTNGVDAQVEFETIQVTIGECSDHVFSTKEISLSCIAGTAGMVLSQFAELLEIRRAACRRPDYSVGIPLIGYEERTYPCAVLYFNDARTGSHGIGRYIQLPNPDQKAILEWANRDFKYEPGNWLSYIQYFNPKGPQIKAFGLTSEAVSGFLAVMKNLTTLDVVNIYWEAPPRLVPDKEKPVLYLTRITYFSDNRMRKAGQQSGEVVWEASYG